MAQGPLLTASSYASPVLQASENKHSYLSLTDNENSEMTEHSEANDGESETTTLAITSESLELNKGWRLALLN